jgi:acetyl-CoA C-acetyltransferase
MREIAIIGIGQTPVDEHWEKSLRELAGEAIFAAMLDANRETVDGLFVGNMLSGMLSQQENLGALIADWVGLKGTEAVKVEAACGSGAAALRVALMAVASGEMDSALAMGVEKMTETKGGETTAALAAAADADYEAAQGLSFVAINALIMQRYLYEFGWKHTDFASFSINAHANALHNPFARLQEAISDQDYRKARMIADPINLLDASPIGDGAAAVLIVPAESVRPNGRARPIITIAGSASSTDSLAVHDRRDPLTLSAARISAQKAYQQAGVGPQDIDVFELHDAFSIMSALSLEACGFADAARPARAGRDFWRAHLSPLRGLKARPPVVQPNLPVVGRPAAAW